MTMTLPTLQARLPTSDTHDYQSTRFPMRILLNSGVPLEECSIDLSGEIWMLDQIRGDDELRVVSIWHVEKALKANRRLVRNLRKRGHHEASTKAEIAARQLEKEIARFNRQVNHSAALAKVRFEMELIHRPASALNEVIEAATYKRTSPAFRLACYRLAQLMYTRLSADQKDRGLKPLTFHHYLKDKWSCSVKTLQRVEQLAQKIMPGVEQTLIDTIFDNDKSLTSLATQPPERQLKVASDARQHRTLYRLAGEYVEASKKRARRLIEPELRVLDEIGRNNAHTRRLLTIMPEDEAAAWLADRKDKFEAAESRAALIARRRDIAHRESRVSLLTAFAPLFDAAAPWEKADFMSVRGLRYIPDVDVGLAFNAVAECDL